MIKTFRDKKTESVFFGDRGDRKWDPFLRIAERKLKMINAAVVLSDLKAPPKNKLEKLKHDREGQHSIRINDKWRVCFVWNNGHAYHVEICDYH